MGIAIKPGTQPGEFGILVQKVRNDTFSRFDALVQALSNLTPASAIHRSPFALVSGPEEAKGPGPDALTQRGPGLFTVSLNDGENASDLADLLRGALIDGTVGDDWLVEIDASGNTLTITDPSQHDVANPIWVGLPKSEERVKPDYPTRDRSLARPERKAPKRTKVKRPAQPRPKA